MMKATMNCNLSFNLGVISGKFLSSHPNYFKGFPTVCAVTPTTSIENKKTSDSINENLLCIFEDGFRGLRRESLQWHGELIVKPFRFIGVAERGEKKDNKIYGTVTQR